MTFYEYMQSFLENYDFVKNPEQTVVRYCFTIKKFIGEYPIGFKELLDKDIILLVEDDEYRLDLELKLYHDFNEIYINGYSRILKLLSHYNGSEIIRASSLVICENEFRLIELYVLNKSLTPELKKILREVLLNLSPATQRTTFKGLRKIIIDSNQFKNSKTLEELADNIEKTAKIEIKKRHFVNKLRGTKITIDIGNTAHDITRYCKLNPIVLSQYTKIKENLTNETEIKRFFEFSKVLNNHCDKYPDDEAKIKLSGLLALTNNEYEILVKLRSYLKTKYFNYVIFIVEILTNEKFDYEKYDKKHLYIKHIHQNISVIRLEPLYEKSKSFALEFYNFFKKYLISSKYTTLNEVSIKSNIAILKYIFIKFVDSKFLDKYGLKILSSNNFIHFKSIKSKISEQVIIGKIKPSTQIHYFFALKWLCEITKQNYIKDYDISLKYNDLAKRDLLSNSYTQKELMTILGNLIKVIKHNQVDYSKLSIAYFALIQIATGLNTSTMCSLKITEEYFKQDENNKNIYILNFIKARANHSTETHFYFKNAKDKTIYLFLYVKDKLRKKILEQATNPEFKTDYFFVFLTRTGELQVAHHENIVRKINELLKEVDCNIRYDSKRMRKTVSNSIYKIVLNKFSVYRELVRHDFDVFVRHYEELNITQSNENLTKGTKALEIYLKNREINIAIPRINELHSDTTIIKDNNLIQFTPLGNCSEQPLDDTKICSDYLACLFCKNFSVISSEAQIHKLLDFKNICISPMMDISSSHNPDSVNSLAIKEFNTRIESIQNLLKQNNPKLYDLAVINYIPNQYFSL